LINCLEIVVTDPDPDYLGIEIFASSARFSGATKIYAGLDELTQLAEVIERFPTSSKDERKYVFGEKNKGVAGGYCALRFYCRDGAGHIAVEVEFEDDDAYYYDASAKFSFPVLPTEIDEFVRQLRFIDKAQSGHAMLENKG
jgi:hypothetical protein